MAFAIFNGYLHWTAVFTPLVLLPLVILTLGLGWIYSKRARIAAFVPLSLRECMDLTHR
jgi:cytochrome b